MKTNFDDIVFNRAGHTYTLNGQELTSVTRLISRLKPPFEAESAAANVAHRDGRSVQSVLDQWERKRQAALEHGTRLHQYIERRLTGQPDGAGEERWPEHAAFDVMWERLSRLGALNVRQVEWVVGDAALGVAGTVDALLHSAHDDSLHLWDWKTGSKFNTVNRWETLKPPFEDLHNCELNIYSLQLSLYRLIVERNLARALGDGYIVHLPPAGHAQIYTALDLRGRLANWLAGGAR